MLGKLKSIIGQRHPLRLLWHKAKAFAAALRYGFPARHLTVIGITGTDGKTTTVGMTAHILQRNGIKVGALSTAFFQINDRITFNATQKTSPSPFIIQKFLRRLVNEGCTHAVLEYSSHGLVQGRMSYTWPKIAAITNISEEHLDYHGTMEQYIKDKGILFSMVGQRGVKLPNVDDRSFEVYRNIPTKLSMPYSPKLQMRDIKTDVRGCSATVKLFNEDKVLRLSVPGAFNLENALCALLCSYNAGVSVDGAIDALATFSGIPGRMERIDEGQPFTVIIDFTVTPQSYERTLSTIKQGLETGKRLLVLTGSCGDRMKEKRPVVGKICSEYADVVVVANEDPYTEDPEKIIDDVWKGIDQAKTQAHRIFDRREAIQFLLSEAKPGDAVLLCGKGSDTTMWVKDGQIPWNEREIVREILKTR